jgi:predicted MFS family arabinose efflux permease
VPILLSAGTAVITLGVTLSFKEPELEDGEVRLDYHKLIGESARTAWRSTAVRTMLFASAVLLAGSNAVILFSQPFLEHHDVSVGLFGFVQAPMRMAGIVGAIAAYRIGSLLGLRQTLIATAVLMAASYALLGGWASVFAFGATAVVFFLFNMLHPLVESYLNHRIPNAQRATILSFRQLLTSIVIASVQPVQGVIADNVSLEAMFWTTAAFVGVTAPLFLAFWLRADGKEPAPPLPERELEATPAG